MGYSLHPVFRQTPLDGATVTADTWTLFTDLGGPERVKYGHKPDMRAWDDVSRVSHVSVSGFRSEVALTFQIFAIADSNHLYDIVNRLAKATWTTELSLDGGTTFFEVVLSAFKGPDPLAGKPFVGASFELSLKASSLLDEIPYLQAS